MLAATGQLDQSSALRFNLLEDFRLDAIAWLHLVKLVLLARSFDSVQSADDGHLPVHANLNEGAHALD